ncbi:MAG: GNAT family N-acetyltransferase [Planctomycetaceae bacterium]
MISVREINDAAELATVRAEWDQLLERTRAASFFHSWAWFTTYWKHFSAGKRMRVLVAYDQDRAVGIVPLVVRTARRSEPIRILTYPLDDWGTAYSPIGADPQTTLTAALAHIRRTPRDWRILELPWVDALVDDGRTQLALDATGFQSIRETQNPRAVIDLAAHGTWDAYLATRTSKCRENLRRKEKRLAQRGTVTYVGHRPDATEGLPAEPRWDLYDACESISRASWQGSASGGSMLNKEEFRAFYRDCHLAAAQSGAVDLGLILVDDRPVAFQYAYHFRGSVCGIKSAYDPAFAFEGVGTVIKARLIADSFARGDHTYDMGPEALEWKRDWLTRVWSVYRYVHFPPRSLVAQLIRGKRTIERRLKNTIRTWRPVRHSPHAKTRASLTIESGD